MKRLGGLSAAGIDAEIGASFVDRLDCAAFRFEGSGKCLHIAGESSLVDVVERRNSLITSCENLVELRGFRFGPRNLLQVADDLPGDVAEGDDVAGCVL